MAVDPRILTDLSIAGFGGGEATPRYLQVGSAQAQRNDVRQARDRLNALSSTQLLAFPTDAPRYWFNISLASYSRNQVGGNSGAIGAGVSQGNIRLPIPIQLGPDNQVIDYDQQFEFGPFIGTAINAAAPAIRDSINNGQLPSIPDGTGAALLQGGAAGALNAAQNAGGVIGTGAGAVQAFAGIAPNAFYTILLKGPAYKTHTFEWTLTPRTPTESATIRNIIRRLRYAAAPGTTAGGALWTFPMVARMVFVPQGDGINTYMFRFKPAVMTQVSATYAPFGNAFYRGTDAPESIHLAIQFLELEYWLERDFGF